MAYNPSSSLGSATEKISGVQSSSYGYLFYVPTSAPPETKYGTTQRMTFATDAVATAGAQIYPCAAPLAVTAQDTGYLFGGSAFDGSVVRKFDFSTEAIENVGTALVSERDLATTTTSAAYLFNLTTCDVFSYATDTMHTISTTLPAVDYYIQSPVVGSPGFPRDTKPAVNGLGVLASYGIVVSTTGKGVMNNRELLSFSSETFSNSRMLLMRPHPESAGVQNNDYGYFMGAQGTPWATYGVVFQTETDRSVSAVLGVYTWLAAGHSSPLAGYTSGGLWNNAGNTQYEDRTQKLVFSTETVSAVSATMAIGRARAAGIQSSTRGYIAGGQTLSLGNQVNVIESVAYSTDSISTLGATLAVARQEMGTTASTTKAYFAGGNTVAGQVVTHYYEIDGIQFSNNAAINPSAVLSEYMDECASMASATKGYFVGAYGTAGQGTAKSFTFSSETAGSVSAGTIDTVYPGGVAVSYIPTVAQTHFAVGVLGGAGSVAANATEVFRAFPTFTGVGSASAFGTLLAIVKGVASGTGVGSMTASGTNSYTWTGVAAPSGSGGLAASAVASKNGVASAASAGSVAVTGVILRMGVGQLAGASSVTATGRITSLGAAAVFGQGMMAVAGSRLLSGAVYSGGQGGMVVRAIAYQYVNPDSLIPGANVRSVANEVTFTDYSEVATCRTT